LQRDSRVNKTDLSNYTDCSIIVCYFRTVR